MNQSRRTPLCLLAALVLGLLLVPSAALAQTIQGTVTDSSGAALPGATVTVHNVSTGIDRTAFTNEAGVYTAKALQPGVYDVTASLEGMQSARREGIQILVGQVLDLGFSLGVEDVSEVITVTSEAPLVEVSRSSTASYVGEEEIQALPISGRDFTEFAYLTPTVQKDPVRGFITMSGQRGIYSGLNIDGTSAKSAFFGYGRGGEATENDGLVVAQDSVKEFQVVTNGFSPEYGANGGGYINVVTKGGTNQIKGNIFYFFRDDSLVEDIPASPLDKSRGNDSSRPVDEFKRDNYGLSIGGPIVKDRTHFFFSYDQTDRNQPVTISKRTPGIYDLIMQRAAAAPEFAALLDGFDRNADGSATGLFLREVDNTILFGKIDHQINSSNSLSLRINDTQYQRLSSYKDEESDKVEDTRSIVGSLVSVIGTSAINEFRIQQASDQLDRLSQRVGEPIEAEIRFRFGDFDSFGKFDFLPIFVEEDKLQVQDNFSYLFGNHDLKFGVDYQEDALSQLFAGSADGRYDFRSATDFLNNNASAVRIYFGSVQNPNYDEVQSLLGVYAQDSWKPKANLTVNYGIRYGATYNPGNLEHIFAEGRNIPDDTNNIAPRLGFAYSLGEEGRDVLRGGIGLFFGRTPSLLFANQVQQNGLYPNFGRISVSPGQIGFVPLGTPIDNENPPPNSPNSPAYVAQDFEDPETLRVNLGYEKELAEGWSSGVDVVWAEGSKLQSNLELNRTMILDPFGRPIYRPERPDPAFNEIFVRESIGESEYIAVTLKANKRWNGKYQVQAHYTWSDDKDTDSNERSATGVTVSNPTDIRYDWGKAERNVEHRFVLSGVATLPWDIKLSGIVEWRSGRPFSAVDSAEDFPYCGFGRLGFNCIEPRAVIDGELVGRNTFEEESVSRVDLRLSKFFKIGDFQIDLFGEVFNLFNENSFETDHSFGGFGQRDPSSSEFGIPSNLITDQRQFQIGARVSFH